MITTEAQAIQAITSGVLDLSQIPAKLISKEVCLAAVSVCARNFHDVPEHMRDESICLRAVQSNGYLVIDLPEQFLTESVMFAALKSQLRAILAAVEGLSEDQREEVRQEFGI